MRSEIFPKSDGCDEGNGPTATIIAKWPELKRKRKGHDIEGQVIRIKERKGHMIFQCSPPDNLRKNSCLPIYPIRRGSFLILGINCTPARDNSDPVNTL
uniref:Uncharacterized protein n=1 Tax=Caenorhabditis japonica TaxID=281687 RepID=A0A8R1I707_CAEJA